MKYLVSRYSFFDSQPGDNKLPHHAISCKNRNTAVWCPASTAFWTVKLYLREYLMCASPCCHFLCFILYFSITAVFIHVIIGMTIVHEHFSIHWCRYVLLTNIFFFSSKRLARPKRPWCTGVPLARCQTSKNATWGQVTYSDLVTWPLGSSGRRFFWKCVKLLAEQLRQIWRRYAPPFFRYLRRILRGEGWNHPPPVRWLWSRSTGNDAYKCQWHYPCRHYPSYVNTRENENSMSRHSQLRKPMRCVVLEISRGGGVEINPAPVLGWLRPPPVRGIIQVKVISGHEVRKRSNKKTGF